MKNIIITAISIFIFSSAFAGGPWLPKKNKGYFKISQWGLVFDQHYTDVGLIDPNVTTGIFNTNFYGEYGITDRFSTQLYFPFLSRNYMNNIVSGTTGDILVQGEAVNSLGDSDLGFKYAVTKPGSKFPIAASIIFGLPLGKASAGTEGNLQTGDGEFNQIFQIDAGQGFALGKKASGYYSGNIGINNRSNGFSDEFRYGMEAGVGLAKNRIWLIARLNGVESFKNGTASGEVTSTSIFANNTEFTSLGFEAAVYATKKFGFSIGMAGAFRGEIIAAAPSFSGGVFYDLK